MRHNVWVIIISFSLFISALWSSWKKCQLQKISVTKTTATQLAITKIPINEMLVTKNISQQNARYQNLRSKMPVTKCQLPKISVTNMEQNLYARVLFSIQWSFLAPIILLVQWKWCYENCISPLVPWSSTLQISRLVILFLL